MKVAITVILRDGTSHTMHCGYAAKSALERREGKSLPSLLEGGLTQDAWAFMAWNQAVTDGHTTAPWDVFARDIDDVEVGEGPNPTGAETDPPPAPSSSSPPAPGSRTKP